jgi:hypothetical protein
MAAREPVAVVARPPETHPVASDPEESSGPAVVGEGPCRIAVVTTPAGSSVQLDGKTLGPSPLTLAASCDRHKVDIAHPRYEATTRFVTAVQDHSSNLDVTLSRPTHRVMITSSPLGAEVLIDGRRAGTTPTVVEVLGFQTIKLSFEKRGYKTVTQRLYSKVAEDRLNVQLTK